MNKNKLINWLKLEQENSDSWLVTLFTKPNLYLFNLLKRTLFMGLFLVGFYYLFKYFGLKEQTIPSTLHGIIGIVIGLLLVFRTNTAYDRWWEARKVFGLWQSSLLFIKIKTSNSTKKSDIIGHLLEINKYIFDYVSIKGAKESSEIKQEFIHSYKKLSALLYKDCNQESYYGTLDKKMADILEYFSSLERIKDTPIPISYSLHIKLSVFAYLLTLPLGLFFGLGVWSIPIVMVLYFIIAGIDIISSEIENPFHGDPNDLPIEEFKKENEKYINDEN